MQDEMIGMNGKRNGSIKELKKELRTKMLTLRDAMPKDERREKSLLIQQALLAHPAYKEASQVLSYVHFRSEAETERILKAALLDKKELYCPKVIGKEMEFYRIYELSDLKPGAYGILEPEAAAERKFVPCPYKKVLMLVPGAAFDKRGFRLGYGGGYYDRYLSGAFTKAFGKSSSENAFALTTAALLYSVQMMETIPAEPHDFAVELLVTENGVESR